MGLFGAGLGGGVAIKNCISTTPYAGYSEAIFPVVSSTNLTVGVRYTYDQRKLYGQTIVYAADDSRSVPLLCIRIDPAFTATLTKPSYRTILDRRFTKEVMAYVSYGTDLKSLNFNTMNSSIPPYKAESLNAAERRIETNLLGRRLRLNFSALQYDYRDTSNCRTELFALLLR